MCVRKSMTYAPQDWEPLSDNFLGELFSFWLLQLLEVSDAGLLEASQRLLEGGKELEGLFDSRSWGAVGSCLL